MSGENKPVEARSCDEDQLKSDDRLNAFLTGAGHAHNQAHLKNNHLVITLTFIELHLLLPTKNTLREASWVTRYAC